MLDFIRLCLSPINLAFTIMLGGVVSYWVLFLIGAVGLDLFDADVDLDADAHVDLDVHVDADVHVDTDLDLDAGAHGDVDTDVHTHVGGSTLLVSVLRFCNVGDVPIMVLVSALVTSMWAVSILSTYYFNPDLSWLRAALWLIPNLIVSLFVTKFLIWPARYVFRQGNLGIEAPTQIVGKTCIITTSAVTDRFGQAQIEQEGAPITLNVRCREGSKPLKRGDEALVLDLVEEKGTYIVVPFDLEVK
jgi:hypothetical protein